MKTKKVQIFLGAVGILGGMTFLSGCGKKAETGLLNLNQEKVINSSGQTTPTAVIAKPSTSATTVPMATPDPGNSAEGMAIKEVDTLLGGVSSEEYSADSLDENSLLSE